MYNVPCFHAHMHSWGPVQQHASSVRGVLGKHFVSPTQNLLDIDERDLPSSSLAEAVDDLFCCPSRADLPTLFALLRKCGQAKALKEGIKIQSYIVGCGLQRILLLGNNLLRMYADCGSMQNAEEWFAQMDYKNSFSWNFLITGYARDGQLDQALRVFNQMQYEGEFGNIFIYTSLLSACSSRNALTEGKLVHSYIIGNGCKLTLAAQNALITIYGRANCLKHAQVLFDQTSDRNVVTWTTMITTLTKNGLGKEALIFYKQMQEEGVMANHVTLISVLDACSIVPAPNDGKHVHASIVSSDIDFEIVLATSLLNMYAKCGNLVAAHELFDWMPERNAFSWTVMVGGYANNGLAIEAIQIFGRMLQETELPDKVTLSSILDACACQQSLAATRAMSLTVGKHVHCMLVGADFEWDIVVATSLLNMYGKCDRLEDAHAIFSRMQSHGLISSTAIIESCIQHGDNKKALQLFHSMQSEGIIPDKIILHILVDACTNEAVLCEGRLVHGIVIEYEFETNILLSTALVNMYGRCDRLNDALDIFDKQNEKDSFSWTAILGAYAQHGYGKEAIFLLDQMHQEGILPNRVTYASILSVFASGSALVQGKRIHACIISNDAEQDEVVMNSLVNMYGRCGHQQEARIIFDEMKERSVISWNTMMAVYSGCCCGMEAFKLLEQMHRERGISDKKTFINILGACFNCATMSYRESVAVVAIDRGFYHEVEFGNAIIHFYGNCGRIHDAQRVFDQMPNYDVISWNSIIGGFAQHGHLQGALELFVRMQNAGQKATTVTFVSILSACSYTGLLEEGQHLFMLMTRDLGIIPVLEHYHCMIRTLGLSGLIEDARDLVSRMPFQPSPMTWNHLLSSFGCHNDLKQAQEAAKYVFELDKEDASPYLMLSNLYAAGASG